MNSFIAIRWLLSSASTCSGNDNLHSANITVY